MAAVGPLAVRQILLSGRAGLRLLNETAVQIDVWTAFGQPDESRVDLLLTPFDTTPASRLASALHKALAETSLRGRRGARIAPLEATIALSVNVTDFVLQILPRTGLDLRAHSEELVTLIRAQIAATAEDPVRRGSALSASDLLRFAQTMRGALSPELRATLLALLLMLPPRPPQNDSSGTGRMSARQRAPIFDLDEGFLLNSGWRRVPFDPAKLLRGVAPPEQLIWRVAGNRRLLPLGVSVETIKADAAQRVFDIDCRDIAWAVIDSGIDGSHPAFRDHDADGFATRVDKAYDFSLLRELASYDVLSDPGEQQRLLALIVSNLKLDTVAARQFLAQLHNDAQAGRPYDWEVLSALIEVAPDKLDPKFADRPSAHGTHVAGVLGGDWRENGQSVFCGVCPNIRLYDLRVLGDTVEDTEFAVIAALEFVRWLNSRNRYMTIHGANLSIGLVHDRDNFACGRTPVCLACEATVAAGVSVVAAAGNWGSHMFATVEGDFAGYAPISIADPGNAASVITVGSTHRERPHEYGVSFFSSRGPTADGRAKPDLVAPGERIDGPLPNLGFGRLDGTSMAAPHVSGVAALLMARHPELIGDPQRVKSVIVSTATDLGRERHFQGAGLVDALRALQAL